MLTEEIRTKFLQYFKDQGHTLVPSSPVVPLDDPTLLFCNAGMNQFKDVFLGKTRRDYTRAATAQKCIRVGGKHNDLDNVGHTTRHMTFFEMLGNFSFGDYFKTEAIDFAWHVATEIFRFEAEKITASVFETDDEAFELWKKHLPEKRIIRLGAKDNYWQMGDTGPCGPCSELLYDRGSRFEGDERMLEFWNLVFMQDNLEEGGKKSRLPKPSIDTGAGLERVAMLKKGVDTVFETDILRSLIAEVENLSRVTYKQQPAFHVIADHLRALAFAIADGAQPSNVERGYVLRKLLRRAVRYGRLLGFNAPFLGKLLPRLTSSMGDAYPELSAAAPRIEELLAIEEESFFKTLHRGGNLLNSIIEKSEKEITGHDAFKLKDTYGFPLEEILLIAKDANLVVNLEQYQLLEEEAKERSRGAHKTHAQKVEQNLFEDFETKHGAIEFLGYEGLEEESSILALIVDGAFVETMHAGQAGLVVLDRTPFYAEKGGQVGDTGTLTHDKAFFQVDKTTSPYANVIVHEGTIEKGVLLAGEPVLASVDRPRRISIMRNHTATHLLHWALQQILGDHIRQAGSLVEPTRLRFDFNHHKPMTDEEIAQVERLVNDKISENSAVITEELSFTEVQQDPSIKQFFGDKYGALVRLVSVGTFSKELCGGTHVESAGQIGLFRISKETSIAKGVRRIEAITGSDALDFMFEEKQRLVDLGGRLGVPLAKLEEQIDHLQSESTDLKEKLKAYQKQALAQTAKSLLSSLQIHKGKKLIAAEVDCDLPALAEHLMQEMESGVIFLASASGDKVQMLIRVSEDLIHAGIHANTLIKTLAPFIGGGGGGKKDVAQAGGSRAQGITDAIEALRSAL